MDIRKITLMLLVASSAIAGDMGEIPEQNNFVIALQGGYDHIQPSSKTHRYNGTDDVFTYTNSRGRNSAFVGGFLGIEHPLPWAFRPFFLQYGAEYNYFEKARIPGINTVGVEPATVTTYKYNYNSQTQQVLGMLRLLTAYREWIYPYVEGGIGAAFNHSKHYSASTYETGSLNLTPNFSNKNKTSFSFALGLGAETWLNPNIRFGAGYRFSDFGSDALGSGVVSINNYQAAVPFSPGNSTVYAHQFIVRISYLI